jgi:RimJ/RimL family protein N-acetyltransferase
VIVDTWAPPTLRTERLVIRPFRVDDLEAMYNYARQMPGEMYASWLGGNTPVHVARYLTDTVARYGRPPRADLGVTRGGELVGGIGWRQVWGAPADVESGWVLHPQAAGHGLAGEAVDALLDHLFTRFENLNRVEVRLRDADRAGQKMLEAFGFRLEGRLRQATPEGGDRLLYGLLRSERRENTP